MAAKARCGGIAAEHTTTIVGLSQPFPPLALPPYLREVDGIVLLCERGEFNPDGLAKQRRAVSLVLGRVLAGSCCCRA